MSIETELIAAKGYLDDCYNAVTSAGGTVPQNQCLANLPDAIDSIDGSLPVNYCIPRYRIITSGGHTTTAAPIAQIYPSTMFSNIREIKDYGLYRAFESMDCFTSIEFTNLTTLGEGALNLTFDVCSNNLISVSFPSLTTVNHASFVQTFRYCRALLSVSFPVLQTISGSYTFNNTFIHCDSLTSISFPALTSISGWAFSSDVFINCDNLTEIHFKSSIQTMVEQMVYYSTKFGASNATIYFDLP